MFSMRDRSVPLAPSTVRTERQRRPVGVAPMALVSPTLHANRRVAVPGTTSLMPPVRSGYSVIHSSCSGGSTPFPTTRTAGSIC